MIEWLPVVVSGDCLVVLFMFKRSVGDKLKEGDKK